MTIIIIIAVVAVGAFVAGILVGKANKKAVDTTIKTVNTVASDVTSAVNTVKSAVK